MIRSYFVYILASRTKTLYIGVTNDLERRVLEHKTGTLAGITRRYNVGRLVYYEETSDIHAAIGREKKLKGWMRRRKIELIESMNPDWKDLSEEWNGEI